ncbi:hypothetical protein XCCB100_0459 [Xanthomonas campestris pv. campestris]|uniref:Uncharacterized protein n=1 Tax=Xanthomonas campestris pv. campestris (strain B100) TaxID=509169 RepID=B0RMV5_XANCB|nr:hypothetical protein XCCB100_0459 [Xanthomonas campestris pv. campestris]
MRHESDLSCKKISTIKAYCSANKKYNFHLSMTPQRQYSSMFRFFSFCTRNICCEKRNLQMIAST